MCSRYQQPNGYGWRWTSGAETYQKIVFFTPETATQIGGLPTSIHRSSSGRCQCRFTQCICHQFETLRIDSSLQKILSLRGMYVCKNSFHLTLVRFGILFFNVFPPYIGNQPVWQNRELPTIGAAGRRLLRHRLSRIQQVKQKLNSLSLSNESVSDTNDTHFLFFFRFQFDSASGGVEGDPSAGRRRCSIHGHSWSFSTSWPAPRQRRHIARHCAHENVANVRLWIRRKCFVFFGILCPLSLFNIWTVHIWTAFRFGSVFGEASGRITGPQCSIVPVSALAWPLVRPPAQDPTSGSEAAEFAHQRSRRTQIGRFRAGPSPIGSVAHLLKWSRHSVVSAAWSSPRLNAILVAIGPVGRRLHIRRATDWQSGISRRQRRCRSIGKNLQGKQRHILCVLCLLVNEIEFLTFFRFWGRQRKRRGRECHVCRCTSRNVWIFIARRGWATHSLVSTTSAKPRIWLRNCSNCSPVPDWRAKQPSGTNSSKNCPRNYLTFLTVRKLINLFRQLFLIDLNFSF